MSHADLITGRTSRYDALNKAAGAVPHARYGDSDTMAAGSNHHKSFRFAYQDGQSEPLVGLAMPTLH